MQLLLPYMLFRPTLNYARGHTLNILCGCGPQPPYRSCSPTGSHVRRCTAVFRCSHSLLWSNSRGCYRTRPAPTVSTSHVISFHSHPFSWARSLRLPPTTAYLLVLTSHLQPWLWANVRQSSWLLMKYFRKPIRFIWNA